MKILLVFFFLFFSSSVFSQNFLEDSSSRCTESYDGSSVSCGGQSSRCIESYDGSDVSCGGLGD